MDAMPHREDLLRSRDRPDISPLPRQRRQPLQRDAPAPAPTARSPRPGRSSGVGRVRPVAEDWDWQLQGACRSADSSLFFHPDKVRGSTRRRREEAAKQVCAGCPVLERCREFALATRVQFGVWGGLSEAEREEILAASVK